MKTLLILASALILTGCASSTSQNARDERGFPSGAGHDLAGFGQGGSGIVGH